MENTLLFDPDEGLDAHVTPTPLSDPVLAAIFQDVEVSWLYAGHRTARCRWRRS